MMPLVKQEELVARALELAGNALAKGNSPFGAILCDEEGRILAEAENTTNTDQNPVGHAEINVIVALTQKNKSKKLDNVTLVSNVQSCPMCFSAAYRTGIRNFVYGCAEDSTLVPKIAVQQLNNYCDTPAHISTGVLEDKCREFLDSARRVP